MSEKITKVGIGVMILKDSKVLLGKRKNSHGDGEYAFPGGHLEYMESFEDCARREVKEECGIEIKNLEFLLAGNIKTYAPKHYVHIGFVSEWSKGEPKVLEEDKCESWGWYNIDDLPKPVFKLVELMISSYRKKVNYLDNFV